MYSRAIKKQRIHIRVSDETFYRIQVLARYRKITLTKLLEQLIDDAWLDQLSLPGFNDRPEYPQ